MISKVTATFLLALRNIVSISMIMIAHRPSLSWRSLPPPILIQTILFSLFFTGSTCGKMANGTVDTSDASVFGTRSVIYTNDWQKLYCGPADDSDPNSCADPGLERFSGDVLSVGFLPEI